MKLTFLAGTRPEIVKIAPVALACRQAGHEVRVVLTGQHDDPAMVDTFLAELGVEVDERWQLPPDRAARMGDLLSRVFSELERRPPDAVLAVGDTTTIGVAALASTHLGVPFAHIEAGLRSFNRRSAEESNRKTAAAVAALHFAPTDLARRFLIREAVEPDRIRVVGNPVVDAVRAMGVDPVGRSERTGALLTAHRASNVDDPVRLECIVRVALDLQARHGPLVFPLHPRTRSRSDEAQLGRLREAGVECVPPLGYRALLARLARVQVVVTDSGGIQEEAAVLETPVVVLRSTTPRWEGVLAGHAELTGVDRVAIAASVDRLTGPDASAIESGNLYGFGDTGARIAAFLHTDEAASLLRLEEPTGGVAELSQRLGMAEVPAWSTP